MSIDSSSIISSSAKIHSSVDIGAFCIIGDDVELGEGHFCIESCNHQRAN
jgi:acyl-[acyl carrier protein]--UDP-N-acetylglucosamine O-acyltransferase